MATTLGLGSLVEAVIRGDELIYLGPLYLDINTLFSADLTALVTLRFRLTSFLSYVVRVSPVLPLPACRSPTSNNRAITYDQASPPLSSSTPTPACRTP